MCSRIYAGYPSLVLFSILVPNYVTQAQELQWRALANAPIRTGRHDDLFFVNASTGWVVNTAGGIHRTTDGGETWQQQFFDEAAHFRSIGFADPLRGWAGTLPPGAPLYETFDGGLNWSRVENLPTPPPIGLCGISVLNDSVIYAGGTYDRTSPLIKSTDRGKTWTAIDLSAHAKTLIDCYFFAPDSGFVVGGYAAQNDPDLRDVQAVVLFTSDGGETWETRYRSGSTGTWCWKISFPSRTVGYVSVERFAGPQATVLKTTDGGRSWEEKGLLGRTDLQGVGFVSETLGWVGSHRDSYVSNDGGETWQGFNFWFDNDSVNRIRMLSDTLGYAAGKTVFKYSRGRTTAIVAKEPQPSQFALRQNHPNPFNPSTTISYSIPKAGPVTLKIYDTLGREIATLVSTFQEPNNYFISFDASNLASGIYFYRLQMASDIVQTKKMLYLK